MRVAVELGVVGACAFASSAFVACAFAGCGFVGWVGRGQAAGHGRVLVRGGGQGRSLGIEELTGAAGHDDTLPMRRAVTVTVTATRVAQSS